MASAKNRNNKTSASKNTRSTAKKPAAKGKTSSARGSAAKAAAEKKSGEGRRFWSFILFFFGIAELLLTYVRGEGLWESMFRANRGIFGLAVFFVAPLMIYLALQVASDKPQSTIIARLIQGLILLVLLSGTTQILFGSQVTGPTFGKKLSMLYNDGAALQGGGVASALIGWPLLSVFRKVGGAIIIILLDLTFILLLSNVTLPGLFKLLSKPFVGGYKALEEERAARAAANEERLRLQAAEAHAAEAFKAKAETPAPASRERKRVDIAKYYRDDETEKQARKKKTDRFANIFTTDPDEFKPKEEPPKSDISKLIEEAVGMSTARSEEDELAAQQKKEENLRKNQDHPEITLPKFGRGSVWDLPVDRSRIPTDGSAGQPEQPKPAAAAVKPEPEKKPEQAPAVKKPPRQEPAPEKQKEVYVDKTGQTSMVKQDEKIPVYTFPPVDILKYAANVSSAEDVQAEVTDKSQKLVQTLDDFGIKTTLVGIKRGPSVTRYELEPGRGVSVSKIENRAKDIALNLATNGVRIAPIPGKAAIGVEVPNLNRDSVSLRELIDSDTYRKASSKLSFAVGKDIDGKIVMGDIATMPHMLIAGTTGSGKSVFTNSIILNILFHCTPEEVKLILIDPKKVEFPVYNGIPHLLIPVVTDPMKAAGALGWAVNEMMRRYNLFEANGVKNIEDFNEFVDENPELNYKKLHYVVIIIDEFADLMLAAKSEVEESVMRLAQLARAAGMHMLIATQSPRTDVITGLIKANIPSRTALSVSSNIDSRVILDENGAEDLLGRGDLLYKPVGYPKPLRIQSGFASTNEIRNVVKFLKNETGGEYDEEIVHEVEKNQRELEQAKNKNSVSADDIAINPDDDLINQAITIIVESGNASTAFLQRKLKLGFPKAARIMDDIEAMGIIGPANGAKARQINISKEEWYERQGRS